MIYRVGVIKSVFRNELITYLVDEDIEREQILNQTIDQRFAELKEASRTVESMWQAEAESRVSGGALALLFELDGHRLAAEAAVKRLVDEIATLEGQRKSRTGKATLNSETRIVIEVDADNPHQAERLALSIVRQLLEVA